MQSAELAGIQDGMEKACGFTIPKVEAKHLVIGATTAATAATAGLIGYDVYKGWGYGDNTKTLNKVLSDSKKAVDAKAFIRKYDAKVTVCTNEADVVAMTKKEKGIPKHERAAVVYMLTDMIRSRVNAAALTGEYGEYIFSAPMMSPEILGHELGHILDFRKKGLNYKKQGPYRPRMLSGVWKPHFKKETYQSEVAAWKASPYRQGKTPIEDAALGTYDKGFHQQRATTVGLIAAMIAGTVARVALA
jgi:hypothetical protein